jgi:RNA polymerase sigma-70 factor (ECF subfamily)
MTLDAIMKRVAEGDNKAFEELYEQTSKGVYTFAYSYLNNREDALDVMQSAYLQVKRKAYTYKGGNAKAWLLQIVKNLALDELRRSSRQNFSTEEIDLASAIADHEPTPEQKATSLVDYMMQALNPDEREIVIMHVFWGYKHREISKILDIPLGTVTWKYQKALQKLEKIKE